MDLEKLALLGIAVFVFMAVVNFYGFVRGVKRQAGKGRIQRVRRLIGGDDAARACAESVIRELMQKHPDECKQSEQEGRTVAALDEPLAEARVYFLGRVENRHRVMFNDTVDRLILGKQTSSHS